MSHLKTPFKAWLGTFLLTASLFAQVAPVRTDPKPIKVTSDWEKPEGDRPDLRRDFDRLWFGGEPTAEYLDYKKARAQEELERWAPTFPGRKGDAPAIPGTSATWTNLGPKKQTFSVYSGQAPTFPDVDAGRMAVEGILTHPTNAQILYLATSGGGLWKTTNADLGAAGDWTWTPVTDTLPVATTTGNVSIGAAAMSPVDPETLFIGLGDSFDAAGRGLYKSINGGTSWTELGAIGTTTRIHRMLVLDGSTIIVGGNAGMWRSTNGGTSFTNLSLGGSTSGDIWSLQRVGTSTTKLVASRKSASTGTFWQSADGGATWTLGILDGLATARTPGRVTMAASAASATVVYAVAERTSTGLFHPGIYMSSDAGVNWTFLVAPTATGGLFQPNNMTGDGDQAFYNHCITVDPANASNVFVGANLSLFRSTDGGASWTQMTSWNSTNLPYTHADFHTNAWSQTGTKTLFIGNDGGLSVVRDPLRATPPFTADPNDYAAVDVTFVDNRRNRGMSSQLVYHLGSSIASSPADTRYRITLGLQDLSSRVRVDEGAGLATSTTWNDPTGTGDGFGTLINSADGQKMMVSSYYARPKRSINGGTSWATVISGITGAGTGAAPFHTQLYPGRTDATGNTLFTATNLIIYKSTDWAATAWTPLAMSGFTGTVIRNFNTSTTGNAMVIGANSGNVWVSTDGGASWTNPAGASITGSNPGNLSYVWFDTVSNSVLYAASVTQGATVSHLWKSSNGGSTWAPIDVSNGFPFGIPVHVIQNDPSNSSRLLAGTDFGVYISENGGTTWARYGVGLPMVAVRDLYIAPDGSFVRAATFGRGAWEISGTAPAGPTITTQPANQTVTVPATATFTVVATGTGTLSYQWKKGATNVGTNSSSYTTPATVIGDNGSTYSVVVTDDAGSTTSSTATLTVNAAPTGPTITTQPANQTVTVGATATFTVVATGSGTLSYQWKKGATNVGTNSSSYTTPATVIGDNGSTYSVVVTDNNGPTTSATATLTVNPAPTGPTITSQPQNQSVIVGQTATFNVTATGSGTLSYQWKKGATNVGTNSTSYTTPATVIGDNGSQFSVVVTDNNGPTTSNTATLTVTAAPVGPTITTQPANATVNAGQAATFTVVATGTGTLTYQWKKGGVDIAGATSSTYTTPLTVTGDNASSFTVNVTDSTGSTLSAAAALTVTVCGGGGGSSQVLLNPGFELGAVNWTQFSSKGGSPVINAGNNPANARTGSWYAWMCGYGTATTESIYQDVTIAAGATNATLRFWLYAYTDEPGPTVNDTLKIQVRNTSGTVLATLATLSNVEAAAMADYEEQTFNLTPYAGQTIRIFLEGVENGTLTTGFLVDDFELNVTAGAAATAPAITTHPATQSVAPGQAVTLTVVATGTPTLYYQWMKNGVLIPGATSASYIIASAVSGDAGAYTVRVGNCAGVVTSNTATLTVTGASGPTITTQPANQTVNEGQTATFTVAATGSGALSYQWKKNGTNVGTNSSSYTTPATVAGDNGSQYTVVVTDNNGSTTSAAATLTVNSVVAAPVITTQPQSQTVTAGASTTFTVVATGTGPLTYQWRRNGSNIVGATSATYNFNAVLLDSGTLFSVVVSNAGGSTTSNNATLTVNKKSLDLNGDATTNVLDLAALIAAYSGPGVPTSTPSADLDGDGDCDDTDLALLIAGI